MRIRLAIAALITCVVTGVMPPVAGVINRSRQR